METHNIRLAAALLAAGAVIGPPVPLSAQEHDLPELSLAHAVSLVAGRAAQMDLVRIDQMGTMLIQQSGTFAQLVRALSDTPRLLIQLRPKSAHLGGLGHGNFGIAGEWLVGLIEVHPHPTAPRLRARGLAHELAHALELACLRVDPRRRSGLRKALIDRGMRNARGFETAFAIAVENQVSREFSRRGPHPGRLAELLAAHDVRCG